MKNNVYLNLTIGLIVSCCVFSSCSMNDSFFDFELEDYSYLEMSDSYEYQEYLKSQFEFNDAVVHPDTSKAVIIYKSDSLVVYSNSLEIQQKRMEEAERFFIKKYPQYQDFDNIKRGELFEYAVIKDPELRKIYNFTPKVFTRSSVSGPEAHKALDAATWTGTSWIVQETRFPDVISYARRNAHDQHVQYGDKATEIGGYVFKDNSALLIIDKNASSSFQYIGNNQAAKIDEFPVWEFPSDAIPQYAFHTHPDQNIVELCGTPGNRKTMDDYDWKLLAKLKARGCNQMLIISNDYQDYTWSLY